jgi:hypothetical protein
MLKGDWRTDRQYVELKKGTGEIIVRVYLRSVTRLEPLAPFSAIDTNQRTPALDQSSG